MTSAVLIGAAGIAIFAVIMLVVPALVASVSRKGLEQRIAARYRPEDLVMKDMMANNFGLESKGTWQARGNGALVLTRSELCFFMIVPKVDIRIPLDRIVETRIVTSHLGKTVGRDLLKVRFQTETGAEDAIAWYAPAGAALWKQRIQELDGGK